MNKEPNTIESLEIAGESTVALELVKLDDLSLAMVGGGQAAMDV